MEGNPDTTALMVREIPRHYFTYLGRVSKSEMEGWLEKGQMIPDQPRKTVIGGPILVLREFVLKTVDNLEYFVNTSLRNNEAVKRQGRLFLVAYAPLPPDMRRYHRGVPVPPYALDLIEKYENQFFAAMYERHNDLLNQVGVDTF